MSSDLSAEITAIATVALAVFAIITAVFAFLAYRKQTREVSILIEQHQRDTAERRIAQASQVFIWTDDTDKPIIDGVERHIAPRLEINVHLKNTSQQPIYEPDIAWRNRGQRWASLT